MATIDATPRIPGLPATGALPELAQVPLAGWYDPVQRVADATVWLLFRISGVRS